MSKTRLSLDGASETQILSCERAHAYLTGTAPRTNPLSCPACQQFMTLIMQNKPNLLDAQMNVNTVITEDYENERLCRCGQNKANQSQYKPNSRNVQIAVTLVKTRNYNNEQRTMNDYAKQTQSNPIFKKSRFLKSRTIFQCSLIPWFISVRVSQCFSLC